MVVGMVFLAIGSVLAMAGALWLLYTAFGISWKWGLVLFFLGWTIVPWVVFLSGHWAETRRAFITMVIGYGIGFLSILIPGHSLDTGVFPGFAANEDVEVKTEEAPTGTESILPPPRPTAQPTHPSWESIVEEIGLEGNKPTPTWEEFVSEPQQTEGGDRRSTLTWSELGDHIGREIEIAVVNGTLITAKVLAVERDRMKVQHVMGGGGAVYWIERDQIVAIRTAN